MLGLIKQKSPATCSVAGLGKVKTYLPSLPPVIIRFIQGNDVDAHGHATLNHAAHGDQKGVAKMATGGH